MKASFAKFNYGRVEYRGKAKNQMTFFDYDDVKIGEVKKLFLQNYKGLTKTFLEIIEDQIDEIPYLVKHFRQAIREMEKEKKITISRKIKITKTGKPKTSIENDDKIIFKGDEI